MGEFPSGQRGQTVNLLCIHFGGSNPPSPTKAPKMYVFGACFLPLHCLYLIIRGRAAGIRRPLVSSLQFPETQGTEPKSSVLFLSPGDMKRKGSPAGMVSGGTGGLVRILLSVRTGRDAESAGKPFAEMELIVKA